MSPEYLNHQRHSFFSYSARGWSLKVEWHMIGFVGPAVSSISVCVAVVEGYREKVLGLPLLMTSKPNYPLKNSFSPNHSSHIWVSV